LGLHATQVNRSTAKGVCAFELAASEHRDQTGVIVYIDRLEPKHVPWPALADAAKASAAFHDGAPVVANDIAPRAARAGSAGSSDPNPKRGIFMSYENVIVEKRGHVSTIWLHRPASLNALSSAHLEEIATAAAELDADPEVRVIVLAGKGRAFTAGVDVKELAAAVAGQPDAAAVDPSAGHRTLRALHDARAITLAAVHGYVVGGGVSLLLACDLRLAAEGAALMIPEVDMGAPYLWGSTLLLVEAVGLSKAKELMLTGDRVGAEEAQALGLVNRVVPAERLMQKAYALAERIASKPAGAIEAVKRMSHEGLFARLDQYEVAREAELLNAALTSGAPQRYLARMVGRKSGD
jgi:enoyl-CoA hydratase/carnithine racemase